MKAVTEKSRMLRFKHSEPNLACIHTMGDINREV